MSLRLNSRQIKRSDLQAINENSNIKFVEKHLNFVKVSIVQIRQKIAPDHVLCSFATNDEITILE